MPILYPRYSNATAKIYNKQNIKELFFLAFNPEMVTTVVLGWLILLPLSNDLWGLNEIIFFNPAITSILLITLILIIIGFYLFRLISVKPSISLRTIIQKTANHFTFSVPASFLFGSTLLLFTYPKVMSNSNCFCDGEKTEECRILRKTEKLVPVKNLEKYMLSSLPNCTKEELKDILGNDNYIYFNKEKEDAFDNLEKGDTTLLLSCCKNIEKRSIDKRRTKFEVIKHIGQKNKSKLLPKIMAVNFPVIDYVFPPLIIFGGLISFLLGFFLQFISTK